MSGKQLSGFVGSAFSAAVKTRLLSGSSGNRRGSSRCSWSAGGGCPDRGQLVLFSRGVPAVPDSRSVVTRLRRDSAGAVGAAPPSLWQPFERLGASPV